MARQIGRNGLLEFGANQVTNLRSWTFEENADQVDTTVQEQANRSSLPSIPTLSGNIVVAYDPADPNQESLTVNSIATAVFYPIGNTTGNPRRTASIVITSRSEPLELDGLMVVELAYSLESGALVRDVVP